MRSAFSTSTIACGVISLLFAVLSLAGVNPLLVCAAAAFPLVVVAPLLFWLDRAEPEPRWAVGHALLFGAGIAGTIAALANDYIRTVVSVGAGSQVGLLVTVVVAAPVVEELAKAAGVRRAARQGVLTTAVDGAVYAGWVALGFTVLEDVSYLSQASADGVFFEVFIVRSVLSPFAHTAFTVLTGLGVGRRKANGEGRVWPFLICAIALHASWNACASYAGATGRLWPIGIAYVLVLAVFAGCVAKVVQVVKEERRTVQRGVSLISQHVLLSSAEVAALAQPAGWRSSDPKVRERLRHLREMALTYEAALTSPAAASRYRKAAGAIGLGRP